jgi:hypothetical protein
MAKSKLNISCFLEMMRDEDLVYFRKASKKAEL